MNRVNNTQPKLPSHDKIVAKGKQLFQSFYGYDNLSTRSKEFRQKLSDYKGTIVASELEDIAKHCNVNIHVYNVKRDANNIPRFSHPNQYIISPECPDIHMVQAVLQNGEFHMMLIKDASVRTGIEICPHCKQETFDSAYDKHKGQQNRSRFLKHIKKCEANGGKLIREVKLPYKQKCYAPHIQKQSIYEYFLAYNVPHLFKPTKGFITYDFETLEKSVDISTRSTQTSAQLIPFMVSYTKCSSNIETFNFSHHNDKNFIATWIEHMFESARDVAEYNLNNYLNDPNFIDWYSTLPEKQQSTITKMIRNEMYQVKVAGFNSSRFDINLFIRELNTSKWKVTSYLGSATNVKSITVKLIDDPDNIYLGEAATSCYPGLIFIDIRNFLAGGTLDGFTKDFGFSGDNTKNFFPYEYVKWHNYEEHLFNSEPFPQDAFYSSLTDSTISDEDYETYLKDSSNFSTRMDYFIHYCNVDTQIMVNPMLNLIDFIFEHNIDMLHNLSISSIASMTRYSKMYNDFNPNESYAITSPNDERFRMTKKFWCQKCENYKAQDRKRDPNQNLSNNVSAADYQYYRNLFLTTPCAICHEWFTNENRPSLDRIDNTLPHTKDNLQPTCVTCNTTKGNHDENLTKLRIRLAKFAKKFNIPHTLCQDNEDAYHIIRNGITGGLSNVQHRVNLKGVTHINKLHYDQSTNTVHDTDNEHIMTHFCGIDFNSLYPSTFASISHDFIPYTDNKMYMPGRLVKHIKCDNEEDKTKALNIINGKSELFIAEIKGHIPKEHINEFINFPPIFRNIDITTDEATLGTYMYNYCKANKLTTDKTERKLTQLLSTHDQYMSFSSYYLWFLIDRCHFVIDDVKSIMTFTKTDRFGLFATEFMNARQKAELEGKKGKALFCKIALNGSYGYDIMNTENFPKLKITNKTDAGHYYQKRTFKNCYDMGNDVRLISMENEQYECKTCIHEGFFNLDNAKFWYLTFIYDFMYKCLDMNRIHFIEGDTDSAYWAIAGDPNDDNTQAFKHVIKDHDFYNEHIFKWAPSDFYCSDESKRPVLTTPAEIKAHEKKLLGLAIEKQGDNMVALCPKCYTSWNDDNGKITVKATKCKGVSIKQNPLKHTDYCDIINNNTTKLGRNTNLQCKYGKMVKIAMNKNALTGRHTKGVVQANGCVHPFLGRAT